MTKNSKTMSVFTEISSLIRARYPILYLLSYEENRLEYFISNIAEEQKKKLYVWTATQGLKLKNDTKAGTLHDPTEVLNHIQTVDEPGIFLLKDFHPFLEDPHIVRRLRDVAFELKGSYKTILILSPRLVLPVELEKDITLVDIPLPEAPELGELLLSICEVLRKKNPAFVNLNNESAKSLIKAAQGLTLNEAENAFAKAAIHDSVLNAEDVEIILKEKEQIIRKSGILEFYPTDSKLDEIGGLQHLKKWLMMRGKAFSSSATDFGLPSPRGVLLLGAPGCGKSLTAKAVANYWKLPLLRLDFGKIFSGLVGSSEENMRKALKIAEGVSPTILWIDEIEKGLAGGTNGQSDGGAGARVFGTFLTWMQEKSSSVFVVATANRIDAIPPELLRRGRFDEIFFMDLPQKKAREEILALHLIKRKRKVENFDLNAISTATEGFSGAELEHVIIEGLFNAYNEKRDLNSNDVLLACKELIPLSITYQEELRKIRDWAKNRARLAD